MAQPKDPTYFEVPVLNWERRQSIPVGWHRRKPTKDGIKGERYQIIAITVEAIASWIKAMQKVSASKTLYPLIQAKNEACNADRVTKQGYPLQSSLVFMDFDGFISDEAMNVLHQSFDNKRIGCTFRSFTEGRAKVAFVVDGTPPHSELKEFIEKQYFKAKLLQVGIPYPDCTTQALTTAFIPSEEVLWRLTRSLKSLSVHVVQEYNASNQIPSTAEIQTWQIQGQVPLPGVVIPDPIENPVQEPIFDGGEDMEFEVESDEGYEDENNILFIPYTTPVDLAYLKANWGIEVEHRVSKLDTIQLGGGWVTGWSDYEGPLPEWMIDKAFSGDLTINPRSVDGKLLRWLLGNSKALCETGIDIPQKDVADYLDASQQAISKSVKKFVHLGWLTQISHIFPVERNTDLDALGKIYGLDWNPVVGDGGEVIAIEIHGHWSHQRSDQITAAMGYAVGSKAIRYKTLDMGLRYACLEVLKNQGREKTIEVVEELLGLPENQIIEAGNWHQSLWSLMMSGHFQDREVWYDYCLRIPGIQDHANSPRVRKLDLIWCWVEEHWPSMRNRH